jgi:O-acetyl-ADP-ribose deacetylase (regulator of RNase III)
MIRDCSGNVIEHPSDALVNTVNTVGVMGKGIALQFRRAYPEMFKAYERACNDGEVKLGGMHVWQNLALTGPRFIINFPTKGHWKAKSSIADVERGLVDLVRVINEKGITSIAVPPLGCGNGGLRWSDVRPLIENALGSLPIDVCLFSPGVTPEAAAMPVATQRPVLTPMRACLLSWMDRYAERAVGTSLLEVQKGMYFFEVFDGPKNLRFVKANYGPYSQPLDHMVKDLEGHYILGFGDGTKHVSEVEPLFVSREARIEADAFLLNEPILTKNIDRVLQFVEGFETPYFMELLATLHFLSQDKPAVRTDSDLAGDLVRSWSQRKAGLFGQSHIRTCWERLAEFNWLAPNMPVVV